VNSVFSSTAQQRLRRLRRLLRPQEQRLPLTPKALFELLYQSRRVQQAQAHNLIFQLLQIRHFFSPLFLNFGNQRLYLLDTTEEPSQTFISHNLLSDTPGAKAHRFSIAYGTTQVVP